MLIVRSSLRILRDLLIAISEPSDYHNTASLLCGAHVISDGALGVVREHAFIQQSRITLSIFHGLGLTAVTGFMDCVAVGSKVPPDCSGEINLNPSNSDWQRRSSVTVCGLEYRWRQWYSRKGEKECRTTLEQLLCDCVSDVLVGRAGSTVSMVATLYCKAYRSDCLGKRDIKPATIDCQSKCALCYGQQYMWQ